MSKSFDILLDAIQYAKDFVESFGMDYEEANSVLKNAIDSARKAENDEYFAKQRELQNEAIGTENLRFKLRQYVNGGNLVQCKVKPVTDWDAIHLRNANEMKKSSARHARQRLHNKYAASARKERGEATIMNREYDGNEPGQTGLMEYKCQEHSLVSECKERRVSSPDSMDAKEKFNLLYSTIVDMAEARKPKEEFVGGNKGAVVKEKDPNYVPDYVEFKKHNVFGDVMFLAICVAVSFFSYMFRQTFDPKWEAARAVGRKQKAVYKMVAEPWSKDRVDAMYAFCSSDFDLYCRKYVLLTNDPIYNEYISNFKGVTRSDLREKERLIAMMQGESAKPKRLDPYSDWVENIGNCPIFGGTQNYLYEVALSQAAEAIYHCEPGKNPDKFPEMNGKPHMYLTEEEFRFCLAAVYRGVHAETKSMKREVLHDFAMLRNLEEGVNDMDEKQAERLYANMDADALIFKVLDRKKVETKIDQYDNDELDREIKEEMELRNLKAKAAFDRGCLVHHFPSLDSRIINGTDCRISWEMLLEAKDECGRPIFTNREIKLLQMRKDGMSIESIAKAFPKNGESESQRSMSYEFNKIWIKPAAQGWLESAGYRGKLEAELQIDRNAVHNTGKTIYGAAEKVAEYEAMISACAKRTEEIEKIGRARIKELKHLLDAKAILPSEK